MSVKGIVILDVNAERHYSQRTLHSFNKFSANLTQRDIEQLEREQRTLSEELRERFRNAAADEDGEQINYELYARDDDKKSPAVLQNKISILNPSLSKIKAPGRLSSPAECRACANRRYYGKLNNKSTPLQSPAPLEPTINAEIVLGLGNSHRKNDYSQQTEEHAHYEIDPDAEAAYEEALAAFEEEEDNDERFGSSLAMPRPTKPQPELSYVTKISHVSNEGAVHVHGTHRHHHHGSGNHAAFVENVSAQLKVDICPECGRAYISGSVAKSKVNFFSDIDETNPYHQQLLDEAAEDFRGNEVELNA